MKHLWEPLAPHQELILSCLRKRPLDNCSSDAELLFEKKLDWHLLMEEAEDKAIFPQVYWTLMNLETEDLPKEIRRALKHKYHQNLARNMFLSDELLKIAGILLEQAISFLPMKGVILAETVFGNLGMRHISDLDILVEPRSLSRVISLLLEIGYMPADLSWAVDRDLRNAWDCPFKRDSSRIPYFLDLHWKLRDDFLRLPEKILWENLIDFELQGIKLSIFSREITLLHLIHHLHHHGYPLKILVDVAEALRTNRDDLDWDKMMRYASFCRMTRNVVTALECVSRILEVSVPPEILRSGKQRVWLTNLVGSEEFYFSRTIRKMQRSGRLRAPFCSLFVDGTYIRSAWLVLRKTAVWGGSRLWKKRGRSIA